MLEIAVEIRREPCRALVKSLQRLGDGKGAHTANISIITIMSRIIISRIESMGNLLLFTKPIVLA